MFNAAPPHLWQTIRASVRRLLSIFGTPSDIERAYAFARREYHVLTRWLRAIETMLRALLLVEAIALSQQEDAPTPTPRRPRTKPRKSRYAPWRFSFRVMKSVPAPRRRRYVAPKSPWAAERVYFARPLAVRAATILQVLSDPAPFARRLARKLKIEPRLAWKVNAATKIPWSRVMPTRAWAEACDAVSEALARQPDSS